MQKPTVITTLLAVAFFCVTHCRYPEKRREALKDYRDAISHLQRRIWHRDCKLQDRRLNCALAPFECMLKPPKTRIVHCRESPFEQLQVFFKKMFS